MRKLYSSPEVNLLALAQVDVITASDPTDPGRDDIGFYADYSTDK